MSTLTPLSLAWAAALAAPLLAQSASDYPIRPVPFTAVRIADDFLAPRLETARTVTVPYAFRQCEETGRVRNFERAAGALEGEFEGSYPFDDSDVYKVIEGASYALSLAPDPELEAYVDGLIAKIGAAQEEDGYLYTARKLEASHLHGWFGDERYERLARSHELYNAGHLFEAAFAHWQATGERSLLDIALALANRIDEDFGSEGLAVPPGHQEIEIGLAKLYRATGERRWLDLARFFLECRGRHDARESWGEYCQDHLPVLEQETAVGHSVRAAYMYTGMADVAALTGERRWIDAIDRIWDDVVGRKLYVTGGIGATGGGEAFGRPYELPNLSAYSETCATIANVFWNHRMFLMHGDARYLDVLERSLYNAALAGAGLDGEHFFYPNPLASRRNHQRSPWFACACCPSNVSRFLTSLAKYVYAVRGDTVYVELFVQGEADVEAEPGKLRIVQETRYPWEGDVAIKVEPEAPMELALAVRIPGWARGAPVPSDLYAYADGVEALPSLALNGRPLPIELEHGFAVVRRTWRAGDELRLALPMAVRRVRADERVEDDAGRVALQRGPIVYCVEGPDTPDGRVAHLFVEDDAELTTEHRPDLLGGVTVIRGTAQGVRRELDGGVSVMPDPVPFTAVPYAVWAHRGRAEMEIWLPRSAEAAVPMAAPTVAFRAQKSASHNERLVEATGDQILPRSSADKSQPFFHWWPRSGSLEWVQYDLAEPATLRATEVYWLRDIPNGGCDVPESWRLLVRVDGEWLPVEASGSYGTELDKANRVEFVPVHTDAVRLEVQLKERLASGVHEWSLETD